MLDVCQRKHMFLGLGLLVAVTIFVLILESRLAISGPTRKGKDQFVIENNSTCWLREPVTMIQECHKCSEFDIVSRSLGVCVHTKYKEILRCQSGEIVIKSCDRIALIDQKNFIHFEIWCFVFGIFSYLISYARERILSRRTHQRLERQLNRVP
ncbi:jumping translocation breakpoint protein JTBR [Haematobia irritans]|uniref:jumping translocation breakpoint protein JTBR n=1 Tax=Haematobia irritans TaxID=7368 RepID=UPI003F4FDC98